MENRLADESGARSGYVIPLPAAPVADDTEDDPDTDGPLTALKKDLAKSRGGVTFAETTRGGNGDTDSRPAKDWVQERFGFAPPDTLAALRSDAGKSIIAACGLSIALFDDSDGTSKREALRQATMTAYEPLGRLVSSELSAKLGVDISLSFNSLMGHDVAGRAAAFKGMIAGGMPIERAVALSGLLALEE